MNNQCFPLWESKIPHAKGDNPNQDIPRLTVYEPSPQLKRDAAVIICPGGGYGNLAMAHEGHDIAKWLNLQGITAFILEYRMSRGGYRHPVPLQDAQRAIRTVRHRFEEYGVAPDKIGILGFSAGGHLASTAGTHFDDGIAESEDPIDQMSSRPDFMILCYPVITLLQQSAHQGSRDNLLGESPDPALVDSLSNETQVTPQTPPTFLWHTSEDIVVEPENSILFYQALQKAGVSAELHIYQKGPHGVGLAPNYEGTRLWPQDCVAWFRSQGIL